MALPPRAIGGKPLVPPVVGPVRPPHTKPTWPPINPPDPVIPPDTPPVDPGSIVVTPADPNPPKPVEPVPLQYQKGYWSAGSLAVKQHEGFLLLYVEDGILAGWPIQQVYGDETTARDVINRILGVVGTGARATTVEPWPPARNAETSKGMLMRFAKEEGALMATEAPTFEQETKAGLDEIRLRLTGIEEHLAGAKPVATATVTSDPWGIALSEATEPAGLDVPLEFYDPLKVAEYARWFRSHLNGSEVFPARRIDRLNVAAAIYYGTGGDEDIAAAAVRVKALADKYSVPEDVLLLGLMTELFDPFATGFGARLERDISLLAGTTKPEVLSDGVTVTNRWVPMTSERLYNTRLLPSGSGGGAGQGGA